MFSSQKHHNFHAAPRSTPGTAFYLLVAAAHQSALKYFPVKYSVAIGYACAPSLLCVLPVFSPFACLAYLAVQIPLAIGDQQLTIFYVLKFAMLGLLAGLIGTIRPISPIT